jgi:hypothetical protein
MTAEARRQIEAAAAAVAAGGLAAIVDDGAPRRAFLAAAADSVTPASLALMRGGRGRAMTLVAPFDGDGAPDHERAALELIRVARARPQAVICPVPIGAAWDAALDGLPRVTLSSLLRHQEKTWVQRIVQTQLPVPQGSFLATGYRSADGREHLAVTTGIVRGARRVLVVVCPQCTVGHILKSAACGCADHLAVAMDALGQADHGILIHLAAEPGGRIDFALASTETDCAERRRLAADDRTARAIVDDLGPVSVRQVRVEPDGALSLCA